MRVIALRLLLVLLLTVPWMATAAEHIAGVVRNANGNPEAGVWVIAETRDLPTPMRKIVVTDDGGRFVVPELPAASYGLWVRGYGLVDSQPVAARAPASDITLTVKSAANAVEAAEVYPASYWLSLFAPPPASAYGSSEAAGKGGIFGGKDDARSAALETSAGWTGQFKLNCILCHQLGAAVTRLPEGAAYDHGFMKAAAMNYFADALGRKRLLAALDAWAQRIAAGEAPPAPPRPQGLERNFVITQWDWGDGYTYAHDEVATDKRDPTVNANGVVYGVDLANDRLLTLDPKTHTAGQIKVPTQGGFHTPWCAQTWRGKNDTSAGQAFGFASLGCPWPGGESAHAGAYVNPANPHNPMMDAAGRVWITTQIRRQWAEDAPAFCRDDPIISEHRHHRQLGYYDPAKKSFQLIDTCFGTHHLQFGPDGRLWTSGDDYLIGWLDPAKFDAARPETLQSAQGYSEVRLDSDGDGKADQALVGFHYGVIPHPADGSAWSTVTPGITSAPGESGWILRYDPATNRHEAYAPPAPGMGPRGIDVDSAGVIWTALGGSSQLARFDRSKCKQTFGTGAQCPEGWTLWRTPGPSFRGLTASAAEGNTDMHYYLWVDRFDTLGMGRDTVFINGTNSDSLLAFDPRHEKFTVIRVPYPLNTYTRGLDGRIDAAGSGWKGRGLWFTNGLDPILHSEKPQSYAGKLQLRPDPLAY